MQLRHALRTITTELDGHTSEKNDEIRRAREHVRNYIYTCVCVCVCECVCVYQHMGNYIYIYI